MQLAESVPLGQNRWAAYNSIPVSVEQLIKALYETTNLDQKIKNNSAYRHKVYLLFICFRNSERQPSELKMNRGMYSEYFVGNILQSVSGILKLLFCTPTVFRIQKVFL